MKKLKTILILTFFVLFCQSAIAQTAQELLGKWQLVKWVKNGKEKDIRSYFKTDQVYQIFKDDRTFESVNGSEVHNGKWHFSNDNTELTLTTTIIPIKFRIDYFDSEKRIMTYKDLGTFTYIKIKEPEKIE
ncbi:DUF5004 domain-containing protein [Chryseobacterium sp. FH2]|uniref:DUF5004 domain-containing protein n=1 Tax=Chryseobacterium sp. FH2 TaxID=1674291 RepID=UPI000A4C2580|nr:DUF5004 domain-containing protein [Chryseobacterium sp. FH2]